MKEFQGISKQEVNELPRFKSYEEARSYLEEKYGEKFVFEESADTSEGVCFFYRLITDEAAYIKGMAELNATGYIGLEFIKSYQQIQLMEDGSVHPPRSLK